MINEATYQLAINPAHSGTLITTAPYQSPLVVDTLAGNPQSAGICCELQAHASHDVDHLLRSMQTYIYYVAEKVSGALEMQRFAHPIHVGLVTAENHVDAYTNVLENLRPTFADAPQPLEVRFEVVMPPRAGNGVWRHGKPIDTDITFGDED